MVKSNGKLRFWGVRGSIPTPVPENLRHGGNTSCLGLALSDTEHLVLDCGTGVRMLGAELAKQTPESGRRFHIVFTHYHFDHIEGLPFFEPLYDARNEFTFYGFDSCGIKSRKILEALVAPPYFPMNLGDVPSKASFVSLDGKPLTFGDLELSSQSLNHPQGCYAFRLERNGHRIVYATDHEHGDDELDRQLTEFSRGADYLIYDAQYQPKEYEDLRRGWGHSTWYAGVDIARKAGAKNLCLFHHHPTHTDTELDNLITEARNEMPGVLAAYEGLELDI